MLVTKPPPIPASRKRGPWDARDHLLMWVHTGRAHVRLADGRERRVDAGAGIRIPAGADHDMWTEPGTAAVPIVVPRRLVSAPPVDVAHFAVDDDRREWLIAKYAQSVSRPGLSAGLDDVSDVLAPSHRAPRRRRHEHAVPMPRSGVAAGVAAALIRHPFLPYTVDEWAALMSCSPSTLRRGFRKECGIGFAEWRQLCRVEKGREHLAAGLTVGEAAERAGFASRNGFARAFQAHHGVTPRDYAASIRTAPSLASHGRAASASGAAHARSERGERLANNVMLWTYRADDPLSRSRRGEAVWMPAGTSVEDDDRSDAVTVPLSVLCTECVQVAERMRVRFSSAWDPYLLYSSVSTHTLLGPDLRLGAMPRLALPFHRHVIDAFREQLAAERARTVPLPRDPRARRLAAGLLRDLAGGSSSVTDGVPREVRAVFREETGMSVADWRHAARMRIARGLLAEGTKASVVASRIGYTQVSNFSRAFTIFHGASPREFLELERDQA